MQPYCTLLGFVLSVSFVLFVLVNMYVLANGVASFGILCKMFVFLIAYENMLYLLWV